MASKAPPLQDLEKFHQWLVNRGRDPDTADLYVFHIKGALNEGIHKRLRNNNLAPLTRRVILASLRAWCKFTKNTETLAELDDIKLPPANRVTIKVPLEKTEWRALLNQLKSEPLSPLNAVIGLMAVRGFRVGDVLRMKHEEIRLALEKDLLRYQAKGGKRLEAGVNDQFRNWLEFLNDQPKWKEVWNLVSDNVKSARKRVRRELNRLAKRAGVESHIYPHRLRRTVATYFLEKVGGDLTKLKDWMGWSNIATAAGYTDYHKRSELDKAAEGMFED